MSYCVVLCTCPSEEVAVALSEHIIATSLGACVNIVPGLTSIYRFAGKLEKNNETLLIIKTTADLYTRLEQLIIENHPYECPEVIKLPIEQGFKGYLQWIESSVLKSASNA